MGVSALEHGLLDMTVTIAGRVATWDDKTQWSLPLQGLSMDDLVAIGHVLQHRRDPKSYGRV